MIRIVVAALLLLAGCAPDPLERACAPLDDPVSYANCRLSPFGPRP